MGEFSNESAGVLLVGVGGIGCELAARCRAAGARRLVDFGGPSLSSYDATETVALGGDADDTDDMDPAAMRRAAEHAAETLLDAVAEGIDMALLLGAVGGQTGGVVLPTLANELKNARCTVLVVAVEPLPFEGAGRAEMAARALGDLEHAADLVLAVPNRPLGEVCDPALPVEQALGCLKRKTVEAVEQLLEALGDSACVGLQPGELRRALADSGRGAFGVGVGRGERRVEEALRDACANSFLTPQSCQQASTAILQLRGGRNLSLLEVHRATDLVARLVGCVPVQVGLSTGAEAMDEVRATLLVAGIRPLEANGADGELMDSHAEYADLSFHDGVNLDVPAFLRRRTASRFGR